MERLVRPLEVVVVDVAADGAVKFDAIGAVEEVNQLVFEGPPKAFDEDIVDGAFATIHADADGSVFEDLKEVHGSELGSLIGVEDERLTPAESVN